MIMIQMVPFNWILSNIGKNETINVIIYIKSSNKLFLKKSLILSVLSYMVSPFTINGLLILIKTSKKT